MLLLASGLAVDVATRASRQRVISVKIARRMGDTTAAPTPVTVDRLRSDETDAGATLLARSFVDERIFAYIFEGRDRDRVERATRKWFLAWIRSCLPLGEVHAARLDGRLVGVGVRIPPGGFPLRGAAQVRFMRGLIGGMLRMAMTSRRRVFGNVS